MLGSYTQKYIHLGHCTCTVPPRKIFTGYLVLYCLIHLVSVLRSRGVRKQLPILYKEKQKEISNPVKGEKESYFYIYRLDLTTVPGTQLMRLEPMDGVPGDPGRTSQLMLTGSGQPR
jgi:hypothetical protein